MMSVQDLDFICHTLGKLSEFRDYSASKLRYRRDRVLCQYHKGFCSTCSTYAYRPWKLLNKAHVTVFYPKSGIVMSPPFSSWLLLKCITYLEEEFLAGV